MHRDDILKLLQRIEAKKVSPKDALEELQHLPINDLEFAKIDTHRSLRSGFSEVIYCAGKTPEQVVKIAGRMFEAKHNIMGTRVNRETGELIKSEFESADFDVLSQTFFVLHHSIKKTKGRVAILAAGTSDLKVAEEARRTLEFYGVKSETFYDVGVAGIHRLLSRVKEFSKFDLLIAVAGMEGALPSVVGGLVRMPVIAVPTSIGYGANFGGITPLLAMLNSCSEGITVVNIDNGFGAACAAMRILNTIG